MLDDVEAALDLINELNSMLSCLLTRPHTSLGAAYVTNVVMLIPLSGAR